MIKIVIDSSSYLYIVFFIFVPDVFAQKRFCAESMRLQVTRANFCNDHQQLDHH